MKSLFAMLLAGAVLTTGGMGVASGSPATTSPLPQPSSIEAWTHDIEAWTHDHARAVDPGWECKSSDNICGLRDKRQLSNPAQVDWSSLLDDTPEMQEMTKKGIDPNSPEGIRLKNKAESRLRAACEAEMDAGGHCSVWKAISHKDGRDIPDITEAVRARL